MPLCPMRVVTVVFGGVKRPLNCSTAEGLSLQRGKFSVRFLPETFVFLPASSKCKLFSFIPILTEKLSSDRYTP